MIPVLPLIVIVVLLGCSAIFSGSEVAYFSLSHPLRERIAASRLLRHRLVTHLLSDPDRFLATVLMANAIVNTAIAIIAAFLALDVALALHAELAVVIPVEVIVVTFVILLAGEIPPKVFAARNAEHVALAVAPFLFAVAILLYPFAGSMAAVTGALGRRLRERSMKPLNDEEIKLAADVAVEHGTLHAHERKMIHGVVDFPDVKVREIMTSRVDMAAVRLGTPPMEIVEFIRSSGHSRLPVYDETTDSIVGILYAKDMLKYLPNKRRLERLDIAKILREPVFVPETKMVRALLREFQKNKVHIAIVVDEFGGTAGLVTLEDVLEEIVGEAEDGSEKMVIRVSDGEFIVDGRTPLDDCARETGIRLPPGGDYDTVAGLVLTQFGHLPHRGEEIRINDAQVMVESVRRRRIQKVRLKVVPQEEEGSA